MATQRENVATQTLRIHALVSTESQTTNGILPQPGMMKSFATQTPSKSAEHHHHHHSVGSQTTNEILFHRGMMKSLRRRRHQNRRSIIIIIIASAVKPRMRSFSTVA